MKPRKDTITSSKCESEPFLTMLFLLTVREPVRGTLDDVSTNKVMSAPLPMTATFLHLWRIVAFRRMVIAASLSDFCLYSFLSWAAPYAVRVFKVGTVEAGGILGTGMALGGVMLIVSGVLCDFLGRKGQHRPLFVVAAMMLLAGVFFSLALMAGTFAWFGFFSRLDMLR